MTVRPAKDGLMTVVGAATLMAVLAVATGIAWVSAGDDPLRRRAILFAASITGCAALSGWMFSRISRGRDAATAIAGGLGASLARLAPMLAALAWVSTQEGGLRAAGAAGLLVAFYLPLLAADILLTILAGPGGRRNGGADTVN